MSLARRAVDLCIVAGVCCALLGMLAWANVERKGRTMKHWKTTATGIAGLLTALGAIVGGVASGHYDVAIGALPAIVTAIGLFHAADAKPAEPAQ